MGKNPAFQFYPNDWSHDLEEHPLEIEGAWIRICCKLWWSNDKGRLTRDLGQWSKILRIKDNECERILNYIEKWKIGDVSSNGNGEITIVSRRMVSDDKDRLNNAKRQERFREKHKNNGSVTPPSHRSSSSSSSSTTNIKEKKYIKKVILSDEEFLTSLKEKFTWIDFDEVMVKMDAWLLTKPGRKKTRRFIVSWLNRIEKPISVTKGPPTDLMDRRMWEIEQIRRKDGNPKPTTKLH